MIAGFVIVLAIICLAACIYWIADLCVSLRAETLEETAARRIRSAMREIEWAERERKIDLQVKDAVDAYKQLTKG